MLLAPRAKAVADAMARAQRPDNFRFCRRREARERRTDAGETSDPLVAEAERGVHAPTTIALGGDAASHRARAAFASCASTTCRKNEYG